VLLQYDSDDLSTLSSALSAETDAQGQFAIPKAPPGHYKLARVVVTHVSPTSSSSYKLPLTEVDIGPGETTTVTVGASNYTVRVRLRWPDGMKPQVNWRTFATIHTPFPKPPAEISNNPEAMKNWWQTPEVRALSAKARSYPLTENADGAWGVEDVAPGEYPLDVNVTEWSSGGGPGPNSVRAHAGTTVTVPAEPPSGTLDLGEIVLQALH